MDKEEGGLGTIWQASGAVSRGAGRPGGSPGAWDGLKNSSVSQDIFESLKKWACCK